MSRVGAERTRGCDRARRCEPVDRCVRGLHGARRGGAGQQMDVAAAWSVRYLMEGWGKRGRWGDRDHVRVRRWSSFISLT